MDAQSLTSFTKSKLADPSQLLRLTGTACKTFADAQNFYFHENADNMLKWDGDGETRIDRFDARGLLDFIPAPTTGSSTSAKDDDLEEELNFERYRDVIDAERLGRKRKSCCIKRDVGLTQMLGQPESVLLGIDDSWNEVLTKKPSSRNAKKAAIGFSYDEAEKDKDDGSEEAKEQSFLLEEDLIQHVDNLSEKDATIVNSLAKEYDVLDFVGLLRAEKLEVDQKSAEEEAGLKLHNTRRRVNGKRPRRRERSISPKDDRRPRVPQQAKRRTSPSYEPYGNG